MKAYLLKTHTEFSELERYKKVGNKWAITLEDRNISCGRERNTGKLENVNFVNEKTFEFFRGFIDFPGIMVFGAKIQNSRSLGY